MKYLDKIANIYAMPTVYKAPFDMSNTPSLFNISRGNHILQV